MTSSDDLIPLTPHRPPQPANGVGVTVRLLDRLLMLAVPALAFLLALLPARNSDLWLHLASGRLLAHGQYPVGVDPFSFTTTGIYWVNPSWLYDLLSFFLFQAGGGTALVLGKAVVAALLGWVLVRLCRTGQDEENDRRSGTALVFAVLALLVVGSSMPLRPICVSYLFLALTLWLLETRSAGDRPGSLALWWPLFLLFALWANLDAWFLLGPLTVGLYALGSLATGRHGFGAARQLGLVCFVGLAACLLNPHHYHAFALPPLSFLAESKSLTDDSLASGPLFLSPFGLNYLRFRDIPHLGRLLYYVLVLLGAVSFVLNGMGGRSGLRRLPAWLVFFAVSALDASTLPFMAIVCGPVTALNYREWAGRKAKRSPALARWSIGGRILSLAILLGLLVAAWPGWLQGKLRQPRGWTVESDTSLVDAVQQAAQWRREGRIRTGETGFNFSPSVAHYCAWFAPEEKSFYDSRRRLFSPVATPDYATVRRALLGDASALNTSRNILREHGVAYLVLHDSEVQRTAAVFQRLVTVPDEWPILYLKGDTIVFGWRDPMRTKEPDRFAAWRLDFRRRAFQPSESERAPARGVERASNASDWRSFWTTASSAPSHDREEAALYLIYFDMLRPSFLARHRTVWELSLAAALVVAPPMLSALPSRFLDFAALQTSRDGPRPRADGGVSPLSALALRLAENYGLHQDDGPPGLLFLAIRAARRAVHENPDDAQAYQLLGEAYLHLSQKTRERIAIDTNRMPFLRRLRAVQAAAAYNRAIQLDPDLLLAHVGLVSLYERFKMLDLTVHHLREELRILRVRTFSKIDGQDRIISALEKQIRSLEERQENERNSYEIGAAKSRNTVERAGVALDRDLAETALKVLLDSDVAAFGREGVEMELGLLLITGRVRLAREWLLPEHRSLLGTESYCLYRLQVAAALGDYEQADDELAEMLAAVERPINFYRVKATIPEVMALAFGQMLLEGRTEWDSLLQRGMVYNSRQNLFDLMAKDLDVLVKNSDIRTVRGLLDVERGNVGEATVEFREALRLCASSSEIDFNGRELAEYFLARLTSRDR